MIASHYDGFAQGKAGVLDSMLIPAFSMLIKQGTACAVSYTHLDVYKRQLVGIAALFFVATYTTVQPGYGDQYNNEAIAGCVMGGTSMVGGLASIGGTVIGVFIISLLQQGIMAFGLGKGQQMIITGIIVIVAVYADVSARRRKN